MKWTKLRRGQLEMLRSLLSQVSGLNHGSNALVKALTCEKIAKRLMESNISIPRASFFQFLVEVAADEFIAGKENADAKRWRYAVLNHEFPQYWSRISPHDEPLGWRVPSQEPPNGKPFDPMKFPYYDTAEQAIDAAMLKRKKKARR